MTDNFQQDSRSPCSDKDRQTILEDIFQNVTERASRLDDQGLFLSVNSQFAALFGYEPEAMIGMSLEQLCAPDELARVKQLFLDMDANGRCEGHIQTKTKLGDQLYTRIVLLKGIKITNAGYLSYCFVDLLEPGHFHFTQVDELFRKQTLQQTFDLSPDVIYLGRLSDGVISSVNDGFTRFTGYSKGDAIGKTIVELDIIEEGRRQELTYKLKKEERLNNIEVTFRKKDGTKSIALTSSTLLNVNNESYFFTIARDIGKRKVDEERLKRSEEIVSSTSDAIAYVDKNHNYLYANRSYSELHDISVEELHQKTVLDIVGAESFKLIKQYFERAFFGDSVRVQRWMNLQDGKRFYDVHYNPSFSADGSVIAVVVSIRDITELEDIKQALDESERRYRALYEDNPLMLFTVDSHGMILSMNNHVSRHLGCEDMSLLGQSIYSMIKPLYAAELEKALTACLSDRDFIRRIEFEIINKRYGEIWIRSTIRAIQNRSGHNHLLMVCEDISENKHLSQQLSYQSSHDSLTGLVNRAEFERRLERILSSMDEGHSHALCYLDLDQFKIVNDTCGHLAGDELLRQISQVLMDSVRKRDTLARLGGDEFGILMEHCTLDQVRRVANNMRKNIEDFHFVWEGKRFILGVSIGLVPIKTGNREINDVMREADIACYAAKDAGRNRVHIYNPDDNDLAIIHGQVQWAAQINHALDKNHFCLYQQKIESLDPSAMEGEIFEILIRMRGGQDKMIAPDAFMPAAERYNLVVKIDCWVFNQVLLWMQFHPLQLEKLAMCSINISGHSVDNEQYCDFVLQKLYESKVPPEKICFEITETTAISNIKMALKMIQTMKDVGCRFALDDFGSGVSSFDYLKQLPVDFLKIDGTFVRDIVDDPVDLQMVRSIHEIAQVMGIKTIAEFVENDDIKNRLSEIGVDYVQGHGIAKPVALQ